MYYEAICRVQRAGKFASDVQTFFQLSRKLSLSEGEEAALLGLAAEDATELRTTIMKSIEDGGPKLIRRLDYAIPILRRMLISMDAQAVQ